MELASGFLSGAGIVNDILSGCMVGTSIPAARSKGSSWPTNKGLPGYYRFLPTAIWFFDFGIDAEVNIFMRG